MTREVTCALSPIRIYIDLSRPGGRSILVGYVAELTTPERRVMGLVGRQTLDAKEMGGIHGLLGLGPPHSGIFSLRSSSLPAGSSRAKAWSIWPRAIHSRCPLRRRNP
jgi:hypothetical protein